MAEGQKQPIELMRQLAAGLARSIDETLRPPLRAYPAGLGFRLDLDGSEVEIDVGYPWDLRVPTASNLEGAAEVALGQAQAELAEATTEPWPSRSASALRGARGLPEIEAEMCGNMLELRFTHGTAVMRLTPIELRIDA